VILSSCAVVWLRLPRGLRYILVGGVNTAVGYALFALCYLGLYKWLAYGFILTISHVLAVSFSFATHSRWVFSGTYAHGWRALLHAWWRFQLAYLGLFGLGFTVNMCMLRWVHPSVWLAQFVATGMGVAVGYTVHRWFVFKNL
jgi:putative flippase GtrA